MVSNKKPSLYWYRRIREHTSDCSMSIVRDKAENRLGKGQGEGIKRK